MSHKRALMMILAGLLLSGPMPAGADVTAGNLRCEYRREPMGIDQPSPRLSWEIAAAAGPDGSVPRGLRQIAYRVPGPAEAEMFNNCYRV